MWCPACGRQTPDALSECKHCGVPIPPSLLRRLLGRLRGSNPGGNSTGAAQRRPVVTANEEPEGVEMPADGAKPLPFSAQPVAERDAEALEALPPELRETVRRTLREVSGSAAMRVQRIVHDDGTIAESVTEGTAPLDPELRAALEKLLEAESGGAEQQIVVEVDGSRQVYESVDQVPPEVRSLLGRFAEAPISRDEAEG
jgi:hypothetical protein